MIEPIQVQKVPGAREIRELTPEEVQSVAYIFADNGSVIPQFATFVGAVENDKVLGFIVLQPKLHAEPMWIAPGQSQLFQAIVNEAEKTVLRKAGPQWVYLFAPAGKISQLATAMGMGIEPFVVMSKMVTSDLPPRPVTQFVSSEDIERYPSVDEPVRTEAVQ